MEINSTPFTDKYINATGNPQVIPKEDLTMNHEDTPEGHFTHYQFTLIHYTTNHGPQLAHHPVPHQYCIHNRSLGNKTPHPINGCRTDGKPQMHEGGRLIPTHQSLF